MYGGMYGAASPPMRHHQPGVSSSAAQSSLFGMALAAAGVPEQPPPQPTPQWLIYYTPEGHPYYYNIITKTTQVETDK